MLSQCALKLSARFPLQNARFHFVAKSYKFTFFSQNEIQILKQKSESEYAAKTLQGYAIFEGSHVKLNKGAKFVDNAISMWPETCC